MANEPCTHRLVSVDVATLHYPTMYQQIWRIAAVTRGARHHRPWPLDEQDGSARRTGRSLLTGGMLRIGNIAHADHSSVELRETGCGLALVDAAQRCPWART